MFVRGTSIPRVWPASVFTLAVVFLAHGSTGTAGVLPLAALILGFPLFATRPARRGHRRHAGSLGELVETAALVSFRPA